jgi:GNAT superfamily N-acetyltransferase
VSAPVRIVDVTDGTTFDLIPPCADPGFDHRSCDYWENADRGTKAARLSWLEPRTEPPPAARPRTGNPFLDDAADAGGAANAFRAAEPLAAANPFVAGSGPSIGNPFAKSNEAPGDNPFAVPRASRPSAGADAPPKLALLGRGLGIFGSYAKVLLVDERAVAWTQFGPLSAYPRAMRLRELYPQLPDAPLPAVITCIATTPDARRQGHAAHLVRAVCDDLAARGFAAVEAYPARGVAEDATSAATPEFWVTAGFAMAVEDERFPVMRREL